MESTKSLFLTITIFTLTCILMTGCATKKLWSGEVQKEYIKIIPKHKHEDVEIALRKSGKTYYCQELYASTYPNNKICYMEKSEALTLQQKIIYTPGTVAIDILAPVIITASLVGYMILGSEMANAQREQVKEQTEHPNGL